MRDWIFDFNPLKASAQPSEPAAAAPPPAEDWTAQLAAARGDDAALLALSRSRAPLEVKLAAIEAIAGEAALKEAEREFRDHDRRVHRLAKQRHTQAVAQREARSRAGELITAAQALVQEPQIALNRLVEIDRGWTALDATLLDPAQRAAYAGLMAQLAALTRERADQPQKIKRWTEQAREALARLKAVGADAAAGAQTRSQLATAAGTARTLIDAAPQEVAGASVLGDLARAVDLAARLDERLALVEAWMAAPRRTRPRRADDRPATPSAEAPTEAPAEAPTEASAEAPTEASAETASGAPDVPPLPETAAEVAAAEAMSEHVTAAGDARDVAAAAESAEEFPRDPSDLPPLGDAGLDGLLQQRLAQWQTAREQAREQRRVEQRDRAKAQQQAQREQRSQVLGVELEHAEAALAAGHLGPAHAHLVAVDKLLEGGAAAGALRARIDAAQAQYAQLKGWQQWGGGRARDELVQQAEALAAAAGAGGRVDAGGIKLSLKQQGELIDEMRARWRELDRLGGATSRTLWQRFDRALKAAHEPIARQVAVQREAREHNLQAREALLGELEAVPLPAAEDGAPPPDWRALAGALDHFHTGWRKLGPVEHTVPHKAREPLLARLKQAVERIEAPLGGARQCARAEREQLVARAQALADQAHGRDLVDRVRELQAQWKQQARALPLQRGDENALWTAFKGAIDAAFGARQAAAQAREADFRARAAERVALIERLEGLAPEVPAAQLRRTLGEVDAAWQRAAPPPRLDAAALEQRFRRARDGVRDRLAGEAQRQWGLVCDAIEAKLGWCEQLESGSAVDGVRAAIEADWSGLPLSPDAIEHALRHRAGLPLPAGRAAAPVLTESTDDLLLQLEAAWNLESPPAFQDARRALKLQAMKAALESRRPGRGEPATPEQVLAEVLRRSAPDPAQRARLDVVRAALRRRGWPTGR